MKKHFIENGVSYMLGADGLYYPDLTLPEGTQYPIGRYGRLRAGYVKRYHHGMYMELLLDGSWNEYLHEVGEECNQRIDSLVVQMKQGAGIPEELKAINQMQWIGFINNVRNAAEEVILKELVYC